MVATAGISRPEVLRISPQSTAQPAPDTLGIFLNQVRLAVLNGIGQPNRRIGGEEDSSVRITGDIVTVDIRRSAFGEADAAQSVAESIVVKNTRTCAEPDDDVVLTVELNDGYL